MGSVLHMPVKIDTVRPEHRCHACGLKRMTYRRAGHRDWLVSEPDQWLCTSCARTHSPVRWWHVFGGILVVGCCTYVAVSAVAYIWDAAQIITKGN